MISPTPWSTFAEGIMDKDQYPILHATREDAEYIIEAVNNYEAQKKRIAELEKFIMNAHTDLKQMKRIEMDSVIQDIIVGAERIMKEVQDDTR
jgi:wobble nucleotide-excising tRNase